MMKKRRGSKEYASALYSTEPARERQLDYEVSDDPFHQSMTSGSQEENIMGYSLSSFDFNATDDDEEEKKEDSPAKVVPKKHAPYSSRSRSVSPGTQKKKKVPTTAKEEETTSPKKAKRRASVGAMGSSQERRPSGTDSRTKQDGKSSRSSSTANNNNNRESSRSRSNLDGSERSGRSTWSSPVKKKPSSSSANKSKTDRALDSSEHSTRSSRSTGGGRGGKKVRRGSLRPNSDNNDNIDDSDHSLVSKSPGGRTGRKIRRSSQRPNSNNSHDVDESEHSVKSSASGLAGKKIRRASLRSSSHNNNGNIDESEHSVKSSAGRKSRRSSAKADIASSEHNTKSTSRSSAKSTTDIASSEHNTKSTRRSSAKSTIDGSSEHSSMLSPKSSSRKVRRASIKHSMDSSDHSIQSSTSKRRPSLTSPPTKKKQSKRSPMDGSDHSRRSTMSSTKNKHKPSSSSTHDKHRVSPRKGKRTNVVAKLKRSLSAGDVMSDDDDEGIRAAINRKKQNAFDGSFSLSSSSESSFETDTDSGDDSIPENVKRKSSSSISKVKTGQKKESDDDVMFKNKQYQASLEKKIEELELRERRLMEDSKAEQRVREELTSKTKSLEHQIADEIEANFFLKRKILENEDKNNQRPGEDQAFDRALIENLRRQMDIIMNENESLKAKCKELPFGAEDYLVNGEFPIDELDPAQLQKEIWRLKAQLSERDATVAIQTQELKRLKEQLGSTESDNARADSDCLKRALDTMRKAKKASEESIKMERCEMNAKLKNKDETIQYLISELGKLKTTRGGGGGGIGSMFDGEMPLKGGESPAQQGSSLASRFGSVFSRSPTCLNNHRPRIGSAGDLRSSVSPVNL